MQVDARSDMNHGFTMGGDFGSDTRQFNITTVRHAVNDKKAALAGIAGNDGPNRPIQSVHSGGAMVTHADGSVRFLNEQIDIEVLYNLCLRDDGNVVFED